VSSLLALCLVYCLVAPNQYESVAKVELRTAPASPLSMESTESPASASMFSAPLSLETAAGILRSDALAWRVITQLRLYDSAGFRGRFASRFPDFDPQRPSPEAQAWLLERFAWRLHVQTIPRTLLIEVRFRCRDAALSVAVVDALLRAYRDADTENAVQSTSDASGWLNDQLKDLKDRVDRDEGRLAVFESAHGIVATPETMANGAPGETQHNTAALEVDELGRQLVAATASRITAEAEYRAAAEGDPEMVIAADPRLQTENGGFEAAVLQQIHTRRSELEQEQAQLSAEHGPNFPRVVEIGRQLADLDRQKQAQDAKLVERFRSNWQAALDREQLARKSLDEATAEGLKANQAATEYAMMRQEANASHELYIKVLERVEEAGLAAGVHGSDLRVVDPPRQAAKPVSPDLPLYLAITFFAGLWIATGGVLLSEMKAKSAARAGLLFAAAALASFAHAQAPTPSTSGLPTGVASFPQTEERHSIPDPQEAPQVWNSATQSGLPAAAAALSAVPMPAPIASGDMLDITESHTPEFHSVVRVSGAGTVALPMIGEIRVDGLDEQAAAHAIEAVLVSKGMLLHPLVSVLVTGYAGQDVSVLGEVARPGVYPYTYHHRLLDLISAASGLGPNAGRLVNIFHASDPKTPHPVVLDPSGTDTRADHNPEVSPGDTVQVSRAGLVYVVGDVIRPGGFPVDPAQGLTVVQALSLAWGPSMNASSAKAVLIREQQGGRTLTTLNLKRMLRGQDPDQPVEDRDIIYVPDSVGKNLWNRTMESAIQSTLGVTIYSALVYSQRY
jgi:polysaccharide biosynthesis/export protein